MSRPGSRPLASLALPSPVASPAAPALAALSLAAAILMAPGARAEPPAAVGAAPPPEPSGGRVLALSLDDATRIALSGNRGLLRAQTDLEISGRTREGARSLRFPRVGLEASYLRKSEIPTLPLSEILPEIPGGTEFGEPVIRMGDEDSYDAKLTVTEVFFAGGRISSAIAARENLAEKSRWDLRAAESRLILRVVESYFRLAKAIRAVEITQAAMHQAQARAADVANLLAEGLVTRDELLSVEAHLGRRRIDLLQARNAADLARLEILQVLALPLESRIELTSPVDELSRQLGPEGLTRLACSPGDQVDGAAEAVADGARGLSPPLPTPLRAELRALDAGLQAARRFVATERAALFPALTGMASAAYGRPGLDPFANEWAFYWTAGVALTWTVWDAGERSSRIEEARLRAAQLAETRAEVSEHLRREAEAARLALREARERVTLAGQIVAAAEERQRIVEDRFDQGWVTPSDLVDAQEEATQARLTEAAALADLQIAIATRERALGQLRDRADGSGS